MAGFGNSFAALVGGFVDGRNIRHGWDDRLENKERQKVLDGYEAERQKRLADMHGWDSETHGMNKEKHGVYMGTASDEDRLRDLAWTQDEEYRAAAAAAYDAAEAGMGARGLPIPAEARAPGPIEAAAAAGAPAGGLIAPMGASGRPYTIQPGAAPGAASQAITQAVAQDAPVARGRGLPEPAGYVPQPGARDVPVGVAQRDYPFSPNYQDPGAMRTLGTPGEGRMLPGERPGAITPPSGDPAGGEGRLIDMLAADPDHAFGRPGGAGADLREAAKVPARGLVDLVDTASNVGKTGMRQVQQPIDALSTWITGEPLIGNIEDSDTFGAKRRRREGAVAGAAEAAEPPKTAEGKPMGETQAETAAAAAAVLQDAVENTPGMAEAAQAVTRGLRQGERLTAAQRATGAQTFMQSYRDNGVPMVTKALMRQGRFTEAQAIKEFADSAATQEGMDAWAGAVFAAQQGDVETAVEGLISAYNSKGYYTDGFEVDEGQTELIRADDGEVMGIKLALRDVETGEVTVTEDTIPDLLQKGLWLMSPQKAAENYMAQQQAIRDNLVKMEEDRRALEGDLIKNESRDASARAREIYKANILRDPNDPNPLSEARPQMTMAEAMAAAVAEIEAEDDVGDIPVMRAPG